MAMVQSKLRCDPIWWVNECEFSQMFFCDLSLTDNNKLSVEAVASWAWPDWKQELDLSYNFRCDQIWISH
jgi:hypothetical protein